MGPDGRHHGATASGPLTFWAAVATLMLTPMAAALEVPRVFEDASTSAALVTVQGNAQPVTFRLEIAVPMDPSASQAAAIWIYDASGRFWGQTHAWSDPSEGSVYTRGPVELEVALAPAPTNWATFGADWSAVIAPEGDVTFAFFSTVQNASIRVTLHDVEGTVVAWSGAPPTTVVPPRDWTLRAPLAVGGPLVGLGSYQATTESDSLLHAVAWGGGRGATYVDQPDGCTRSRAVAGNGESLTLDLRTCEDPATYFRDIGASETIVSSLPGTWAFVRERAQHAGPDGPWLFAADLPCLHRPLCGL